METPSDWTTRGQGLSGLLGGGYEGLCLFLLTDVAAAFLRSRALYRRLIRRHELSRLWALDFFPPIPVAGMQLGRGLHWSWALAHRLWRQGMKDLFNLRLAGLSPPDGGWCEALDLLQHTWLRGGWNHEAHDYGSRLTPGLIMLEEQGFVAFQTLGPLGAFPNLDEDD